MVFGIFLDIIPFDSYDLFHNRESQIQQIYSDTLISSQIYTFLHKSFVGQNEKNYSVTYIYKGIWNTQLCK